MTVINHKQLLLKMKKGKFQCSDFYPFAFDQVVTCLGQECVKCPHQRMKAKNGKPSDQSQILKWTARPTTKSGLEPVSVSAGKRFLSRLFDKLGREPISIINQTRIRCQLLDACDLNIVYLKYNKEICLAKVDFSCLFQCRTLLSKSPFPPLHLCQPVATNQLFMH